MPQNRKLQVFVSSTYTDLQKERQAAVEAILRAGHIPAGMELFAAGDRSQMDVIRSWIDESDVYMLILGARYGSIERNSRKSYVQLEYEYACERNKPIFAVVIDEAYLKRRMKRLGPRAPKVRHAEKLRDFRAMVESKMVRFWRDPNEIKLAIWETLADFSRRDDIQGWVHGSQARETQALTQAMTAEINRLTKENDELKGGLPWLFKEADLVQVESAVPEKSSVWVVTPNIFHVKMQPNLSRVVRQNAERGVTYTYIYPRVNKRNAPHEQALKSLFSGRPDRLSIRHPGKEAQFSSLAITHYRILNPDSVGDAPARAFLELPVQPPGYWIDVDSDGVQGLIGRFYDTANGL